MELAAQQRDRERRPRPDGSVQRDWLTIRVILLVGLPPVAILMALAAANVGGLVVLWEPAHTTLAGLMAVALVASAALRSSGLERRMRLLVALGVASWCVGQLAWDLQIATGFVGFPTPSDAGYLGIVVPVAAAFVLLVRDRLSRAEELAVYLDSGIIFLAITAVILSGHGSGELTANILATTVTYAYPILHLATAGAGFVALLAIRGRSRASSGYILLGGFAVVGLAWIAWLRAAEVATPVAGAMINYFFTIGLVIIGMGGATWKVAESSASGSRRQATAILGALPLVALLGTSVLMLTRHLDTTELGLDDVAGLGVIFLVGVRQTWLVHERGRLLRESSQARAQLQEALTDRSEADVRYRVLVESVPAAVYIDLADAAFSGGGRVSYMSPQIEGILGYPPEAFMTDGDLWPQVIHPDDLVRTVAAYQEHWRSGLPLRADYRMIARDGSVVWVHDEAFSVTDRGPAGRRWSQGLIVNTTEQKRLEEQLLHDALHDPLTGLANRVLFRDCVERALAGGKRRRSKVAVLFLDLDNFKLVNDSLGHRAGDRLLVEVGRRLGATIRATDVAARQGGDEFTILLDRVRNVEQATASAERIAMELRKPIEVDGRAIIVAVSIGVAMADGPEIDADDLLAHADAAMYEAKAQGRDRHAVFDPAMRILARGRLQMEAELRVAIDEEQFELHYQPIVDLASNRVAGLEALVRWRHPVRGLLAPMEFIPLAELSGLIVPLGRLITTEACRQLRAMRDARIGDPRLTMSVNLSPRQAAEPGFVAEVAAILAATGVEPSCLVLEITESLMLDASATSDGTLRQLREMGVQLVVDDFGTGFSALEYFKRFALQGLKIDRSFIDGLGRSREDTAIVTATLAFARALGLTVTAEGVETAAQLAHLRSLGCPQGQGFLFSRPVPAADLPALLAATVLPLPPALAAA
jgi:diguanylate cyclase (GGDEF)-like protein/PAS domain S-box-containing protein